jgi:hypothetical protein
LYRLRCIAAVEVFGRERTTHTSTAAAAAASATFVLIRTVVPIVATVLVLHRRNVLSNRLRQRAELLLLLREEHERTVRVLDIYVVLDRRGTVYRVL